MNILCPNCHKNLTVPEQYAGQLMKCPLCSGNFSVPALPPGGVPDPAPAFSAPVAPPPMPAAPPAEAETYGVKHDPAPMPAFMGPPERPADPPQPAFATSPAPAPALAPAPAPAPAPKPAPLPTTPGDYTGGFRLVFSEAVLKFIPAAALLLIFVLQFNPWVGIYPGGELAISQGAWGAATGGYYTNTLLVDKASRPDPKQKKRFTLVTAEELKELNADRKTDKLIANEPGFSPLLFVYLVLLFLPTLVVTVGVAILPYVHVSLPAAVQQFLPWRWTIVAVLNVVLLLFLVLQLVLGFSLETNVTAWVDAMPSLKATDPVDPVADANRQAMRGEILAYIKRTTWLTMAFWLHVLAAGAAATVWWMEKRGPGKPAPVLELRW